MPISIRECLTRYCDLTSAPLRSDLKLLAAYAKDPTDQKALLRMSSKEGKAEYREKVVDAHVGLVDLLRRCPSIEIPLEHLLNLCPLLQTRFYTISSSSSVHPDTVHLTVAVTRYDREDGSTFSGVCSNHVARCEPGASTLRVFNRPSTFRLPGDASRPVLMVGPGTGIAPMRAILQERSHQRRALGRKVGPNVLYFGCKNSKHDFLYEDELKEYQKAGDLAQLHLAFSREQKEKVYVQHLLRKNAKETWKMIDGDGAYVFVCGGVKMGHEVTEVLKDVFSSQGGMAPEDAKEYLAKLTEDGRYVQELWS
jgi:NADPH-ferrihemoprotein reductase